MLALHHMPILPCVVEITQVLCNYKPEDITTENWHVSIKGIVATLDFSTCMYYIVIAIVVSYVALLMSSTSA